MADPKGPAGFGFADIINQSSQLPELGGAGKDLPDGFPLPMGPNHRMVDTTNDPEGIPGVVAYDFKVHRKVFVIYRPWEACTRCKNSIASSEEVLDPDADHTCKHTDLAEYEKVVNQILEAHFLYGGETETVLKDGSVIVSMRWFDKKLNHKKMRQMEKEARRAAAQGGGQREEPSL